MRRILWLATVALVVAAMMVSSGPAWADMLNTGSVSSQQGFAGVGGWTWCDDDAWSWCGEGDISVS